MVTFADLVSPLNQAGWVQFLLSSLQGIGPVIQSPAPNTNQLYGTGSLSVTGPATQTSTVVILIMNNGITPSGNGNASTSDPAFFQFSVDGGLTFQPSGGIDLASLAPSFTFAVPGTNVSILFENGSYTTAGSDGFSFVVGETYSFQTNTPTFPVTNWPAIGVGNALVQTDAQALADLNVLTTQAIAGGFTQSWINPPIVNGVPTPPPDGWADLIAQNFYNRYRTAPLQTQGLAVLTAVSTAGPYTILPGQVFASTPNGQYVFINTTGGTLSRGGSLKLTFQAMNPGAAYNQVESVGIGSSSFWLTSLITPLAGVSISNPLQDDPTVNFVGSGSGTISVAAGGGGPAGEYSVVIRIVQAGAAGTATFQFSLDGGASFTAPITTPGSTPFQYTLGASNMIATFGGGTFDPGDLFTFTTGWITQRGVDAETSPQLMTDCQNQWTTLAANGANPTGTYKLWAKAASPEVIDSIVTADPIVPGQVDITLIGAAPNGGEGPVSSAALAAVTAYIQARIGLTLSVSVGTVSQVSIAVAAAYIICRSAYRNTVVNACQTLLNKYEDTIFPGGTVELSEIAAIIQQAPGVTGIEPLSSLTLNGNAADVPMNSNQVPNITGPQLASFKFI